MLTGQRCYGLANVCKASDHQQVERIISVFGRPQLSQQGFFCRLGPCRLSAKVMQRIEPTVSCIENGIGKEFS
jgi:hypothetical protein